MKSLFILSALFISTVATASSDVAKRVQMEFHALRNQVSQWEPEYSVGEYMYGKQFGDHEVLWRLSEKAGDSEVIRIYRNKGKNKDAFAVTFHYGTHIVDNHTVIRRFFGPAQLGWRNDTVDAVTGEYLGSQGMSTPALDKRDHEIMRMWGIKAPK